MSEGYSARQHYAVEVELADRLRGASKQERLDGMYSAIYAERIARIPNHPLVRQSRDHVARARATRWQVRLLDRFHDLDTVCMEVGPGDCAVALALARRVRKVFAVDVTDTLVNHSQLPPTFHFVASDGVTIPLPPGSIELAYSNQVLEHLHPDDVGDHLRSIHAALAPGGRFICVTPNRLSGPWDISRHFGQTARGLHLKEYTVSEVIDLFKEVGFDVDLIATYHGRRLVSKLPERIVRLTENVLERFPLRVRRLGAAWLTAVKVVGTKPELTDEE